MAVCGVSRRSDLVGEFCTLSEPGRAKFNSTIGEVMSKKGQRNSQPKPDRLKGDWKALEIVHPRAAGIDIGGSEHWVAINPELDEEPVRCFGCFTADLEQMADWLVDRGVRSVAMQSTGVGNRNPARIAGRGGRFAHRLHQSAVV